MTDPLQPLFDAVNVSGLAANSTTLMVSLIGVTVLFLGYGVVRKVIRKGA